MDSYQPTVAYQYISQSYQLLIRPSANTRTFSHFVTETFSDRQSGSQACPSLSRDFKLQSLSASWSFHSVEEAGRESRITSIFFVSYPSFKV